MHYGTHKWYIFQFQYYIVDNNNINIFDASKYIDDVVVVDN